MLYVDGIKSHLTFSMVPAGVGSLTVLFIELINKPKLMGLLPHLAE